ncbi:CpsD/CapB family tyrosine-protein kinase [Alteribacillus sp. HJP-4]|uniref:CpsD/CapB family tyrosine-protein kinase n=1 Tax=Alteribacillus sp. HJP-4 TaxID=2775394 RepID=UPI0035CCEA23
MQAYQADLLRRFWIAYGCGAAALMLVFWITVNVRLDGEWNLEKEMIWAAAAILMLVLTSLSVISILSERFHPLYQKHQIDGFLVLGKAPSLNLFQSLPALRDAGMYDSRGRKLITIWDPDSSQAEGYRKCQLHIVLKNIMKSPQVISITAPHSEDGISVTSGNLAAAFAQAGYRTLLLDAHIRNPVGHYMFKTARSPGFGNYLEGEAEITKMIQPTFLPNLYLLGPGNITEQKKYRLREEAISAMYEQLRELYDYVIIDCPSVEGDADALLFGKAADQCILVVNYTKGKNYALHSARDQLIEAGVPLRGIFLNRWKK